AFLQPSIRHPSLLQSRRMHRLVFFFYATPNTVIYPLSLHDALPIYAAQIHHDQDFGGFDDVKVARVDKLQQVRKQAARPPREERSEEHTSELQSRENLVCRLLLEKKKNVIQSDVDETSGYG